MTKAERKAHKLQPRIYKPSTGLGKKVIDAAKALDTGPTHIAFDYSSYPHKISVLENLVGKKGWLIASELRIRSFEDNTYLFFAACDEDGNLIPDEAARKLFKLEANATGTILENPYADRSPGPFERNTPSGFRAIMSAAFVFAGTTVTLQPVEARQRRMLRFMPKSIATTWKAGARWRPYPSPSAHCVSSHS